MRFGVLHDFRNPAAPQWHVPWTQFCGATFEHMEEVERLADHGFMFPHLPHTTGTLRRLS